MASQYQALVMTEVPEYCRTPAAQVSVSALLAKCATFGVLAACLVSLLALAMPSAASGAVANHIVPMQVHTLAARTIGLPRLQANTVMPQPQREAMMVLKAEDRQGPQGTEPAAETVTKSTEFGYSRKDVILICFGIIAGGYAFYYGLQFAGLSAESAGTTTMILVNLGLTFGWVGSYVFRVGTKDMTYTKQLKDYEEKVMMKRFEEMTDEEREALADAPVPKPEDPKSVRRWI